jgi:histidinol phosphatase-like PHP family hydrolase
LTEVIDLHTHTLLSDGALLPVELLRRAEVNGYAVLGISDHVDMSNLDFVVPRIAAVAREWNVAADTTVKAIPGAEITHVPPTLIGELVEKARGLGALYVVVHGETTAEPVAPGTNRAAIDAGCDILAHPGLIAAADAEVAAKKGVLLEITSRQGHSRANGHVLQVARKTGAGVVINSDAHAPEDILTADDVETVGRGAGMSKAELSEVRKAAREFAERLLVQMG